MVLLTAFSTTSCGSGVGDCSGTGCGGQTTAHWTAARAAVAVDQYTEAPTVPGRLSGASCRIYARNAAHEAKAICSVTFTAPHKPPRQIRVTFDLSGIGVVNVECPGRTGNNPYCAWLKAHP